MPSSMKLWNSAKDLLRHSKAGQTATNV